MRSDMYHVVIDRPRTGGEGGKSIEPKGAKRKRQSIPTEELPKFESSSPGRKYAYGPKQLNEHLTPLIRFLRSKVGYAWNEVYSEICENISLDSATQRHVRDHVDQMVDQQHVQVGKKIYEKGQSRFSYFGGRYSRFYVDKQGRLQYNSEYGRHRRYPAPKPEFVPGKDEFYQYHLIKGIWYEIELKPTSSIKTRKLYNGMLYGHAKDMLIEDYIYAPKFQPQYALKVLQDKYGRSDVYGASKRQMNKREIKKLKLWEKIRRQ